MARRQLLVFLLLSLTVAAEHLPAIQTLPSRTSPFIFHHQRKAGGTSLRIKIATAARKSGVPEEDILVPCEGGTSCYTWSWHHLSKKPAVVCGHFSVAEVWYQHWVAEGDPSPDQHNKFVKREHASCLTNFRHPVSRVVSCLFYRFPSFEADFVAGKVTVARLEEYLDTMSMWGYGCNNEAIRVMSGYGVEATINRLSSQDPNLIEQLIRMTVKETQRCVLHVLDPPASLVAAAKAAVPTNATDNLNQAVMLHFFPWLLSNDVHENSHEHVPLEDEELLRVIARHNWPEIVVYHEALRIFAEQLAAALGLPPGALIGALPTIN